MLKAAASTAAVAKEATERPAVKVVESRAARPAAKVVVQVLKPVKPPCRARSFLWDSRGTAFLGGWPSPPGTMRRPSLSTPLYRTRSRRWSATCRPNLT